MMGARLVFSGILALGLAACPALLAAEPPVEEGPTEAERTERARALFDEAEGHYARGAYADALAGYAKAYQVLPLPAFLFNIAQCHRMLGKYDRAIYFYEGYLRDSPARPRQRAYLYRAPRGDTRLRRRLRTHRDCWSA